MVGPGKLPIPWLICIFNAVSQYILLFEWPDFCLKCLVSVMLKGQSAKVKGQRKLPLVWYRIKLFKTAGLLNIPNFLKISSIYIYLILSRCIIDIIFLSSNCLRKSFTLKLPLEMSPDNGSQVFYCNSILLSRHFMSLRALRRGIVTKSK